MDFPYMDDRNKLGTKWFHLKFIKNMRENTKTEMTRYITLKVHRINPAVHPRSMFNPYLGRYTQVLVVLSVLLGQI